MYSKLKTKVTATLYRFAGRMLLTAVAVIYCSLLSAQVTIHGKVIDKKSGETLPGAHIEILNTLKKTISGPGGEFTISGLSDGKHSLKASYIGYKTLTTNIEAVAGKSIKLELESSPLMQDEVVILSTRASENTPGSYTNISRDEIERINLGRDLPYLLEHTPSVVVSSDAGAGVGYTNIRIRGTDMNRINISLNGIPLNDAESHGVWWVNMPDLASSVNNVQIQRGVGTSTNGAAAFGANINMQTSTLNPLPYAEISNSFGSFNTRKHSLRAGTGLMANNWSIDARLSGISSDGYIDRASTHLRSYYTSAAWYGEKSLFRINVLSGSEKTYQAWDGVPSSVLDTNRTWNGIGAYKDADGGLRFYDNETDNYKQDHYQLFYSRNIKPGLDANIALHYTKGFGYYEQYKARHRFSAYGLSNPVYGNDTITRTDLIRRKYLDNHFYGTIFSVNYNSFKRLQIFTGGGINRYDGDHYGDIIWMQYPGKTGINHRWYSNLGVKTDYNIYTKMLWLTTDKLNIYTDVQYRGIDYSIQGTDDDLSALVLDKHYDFFNPKVGASYYLSDKHRLSVNYAIAHREPTRSNFKDADPGREPLPERLYNLETAYNLNMQKINAGINIYSMNYINQLVLTGEINNVGYPIMTNAERSFRRGVEIYALIKPIEKLSINANTSISQNRIYDFVEYVDDWDTWSQRSKSLGTTELAFSPAITAGGSISIEAAKNLNLSIIGKYVGRQYIDNTKLSGSGLFTKPEDGDRSLNSYFVNNLLVSYTFSSKLFKEAELILSVNNLFNVKYETNAWVYRYYENDEQKYLDGYFPQAGINFLAGLKIKL